MVFGLADEYDINPGEVWLIDCDWDSVGRDGVDFSKPDCPFGENGWVLVVGATMTELLSSGSCI
jgi:hypothetical protein